MSVKDFTPGYEDVRRWAIEIHGGGYQPEPVALRFGAWFSGFYVEEIAADDPSLNHPTAWERILECFSDVAESWGY
jgi:hypothetical protein